ALWHVQRAFDSHVLADERLAGALIAFPHAQAGLDRLLQKVKSLAQLWKPQSEAIRFLLVVAGAYAEHRPTTGEDVEGGHHLGQQPSRPVRDGSGESHE